MDNLSFLIYCKKTEEYFGIILFEEKKFYEAYFCFDLLHVKGEKSFLQIENIENNEWFHEHFILSVEAKKDAPTEEKTNKLNKKIS